jgi:hypothetical protein
MWLARCIALAFLALSLFPQPALAQSHPDSVSVLPGEKLVLHHLLETDDWLAIIPFAISYNATPSESINELFTFRLLEADSLAELGAMLPEAFYNNGWGDGTIAFYFSADDAPAWGENYIIRVDENPSQFSNALSWTYSITAGDYTSDNTAAGNEDELTEKILEDARRLSDSWGFDLYEESDDGRTVLNSYGSAYYRRVIRGIQAMAPDLFAVYVEDVDFVDRSWDYTLATTFLTRFSGTWVENAATGFADFWGMDRNTGVAFPSLLLAIGAIVLSSWKFKQVLPGFTDAVIVFILCVLLGWFQFTVFSLMTFLVVMIMGVILFLNRA